jgi:hypothetical protein
MQLQQLDALLKGISGHRVRRHVARPAGRRQAAPAGRCSRRTISPISRRRRALLGQLLHKNIVSASAASRIEPARCCLVTELAPFGSLKSVLDRVGEREARAAVCLPAAPPLAYTRRRSCNRDIKPAQPARLQSLVERMSSPS